MKTFSFPVVEILLYDQTAMADNQETLNPGITFSASYQVNQFSQLV
jgi:hypothetical protein